MSDKNIFSVNKEKKSIQNKVENSLKSSSPKQYNSSSNLQYFHNIEINQRNFPSKANFFGQNNSNERNISPGNQSPVLNYYTSLSPKFSKIGQNFSPEKSFGGENLKHSPLMSGNLVNEQAFNFSPSNIFNINQKNNANNYSMLNNNNIFYNHQNGETNININNKSLAEKMEHLVGKKEDKNSLAKIQNNEQKSDEEDENGNDEMYLLTLDICDDKENEEELNNNSHNINFNDISNHTNNINYKNINNSNKNNTSPKLGHNTNNILLPNSLEENLNNEIKHNNINKDIINNSNDENEKNKKMQNNDEENEKKVGMMDKILNSGEIPKPYIPNKYRNNIMEINQINSFQDDNMLPSYGGTNNNNSQVNSFTINNNINNNFNINNSIINNNLIGNSNFNMGSNNFNNNINSQNNNNLMTMNQNNPLQIMKEKEVSPYPTKIGEFLYHNLPNQFNSNESNNKFEINNNMNNFIQIPQGNFFNNNNMNNMNNMNNINNLNNNMNNNMNINNNNFSNINNNINNNYINNFYYKGDNYQISQFKKYKKQDNSKAGQIRSICADDFVTTITANNKKIKRIDPNTYLNESLEYLSFNILPLAKDQAGCRFLQEKLDKEQEATNLFFNAILPHILILVKDPFGNYLIQKLCNNLNQDQIIKILEKISPTILDIGSNNHGTRVIQHLINFLTTKKLLDYFIKSIEPFVIPLLKELNGTHIIQQLLIKHSECASSINKIIVENCASLASHSHGCCVLQKFLNGKDKNLKESLINNLINNCLVLIIDQYGNYVIQSILLLNEKKSSSAIAMKIYDNVAYYSKHRYSSNVVEKCFDFCGKNERKKLVEKLSPPDILADLIMDEHGNYVIQKALSCSEANEQEIILKNIIPLIPKINNVSFGEKLLSRLMSTYPQFKNSVLMMDVGNNLNLNNMGNFSNFNYSQNMNNNNSGYNNYKKGNKKKKGNKNNNNNFNNNNYFDNNTGFNNNNFFNNDRIMNNNMYMQNLIEDGRNKNNGNEGKNLYKNRGNKKNYKNWRDFKEEQKKGRQNNNFKNNNNNSDNK